MSNLFVWALFIEIVLEVPMCKHILDKLDCTGCTEAHRLYVKMAACCLHFVQTKLLCIIKLFHNEARFLRNAPFALTTEPLAAIVLLFPPREILKTWAWVQTRGLHACFERNTLPTMAGSGPSLLTLRITSHYWPCLCAAWLDSSCS